MTTQIMLQRRIELMRESMSNAQVPEHLREGLLQYMKYGHRPGDFLIAVLRNDLHETVLRASPASFEGLPSVMRWLYWEAPADSWGTSEKVRKWQEFGGLTQ